MRRIVIIFIIKFSQVIKTRALPILQMDFNKNYNKMKCTVKNYIRTIGYCQYLFVS
jgi:hypothetical protein